ncbi:MAG: energy transducer TonB [Bacteroidales bacterium]|nr:energy transducer TonB [Bacteroidales bacterium]
MKKLSQEDRAGLYTTVIVHLAVLIVLLGASLGWNLSHEHTFILDFTKQEEQERREAELRQLQAEADMQQAIREKLEKELGGTQPEVRNVAVDRGALRDDRGTDAEQLYKDAERLNRELQAGYQLPGQDDVADPGTQESKKEEKKPVYTGPSVVSYLLEGRKAVKLSIPAYRCQGGGEVTVLISVDASGKVVDARVDEPVSSTDACLRAFAIRAARLSRFSADSRAPARQNGNIVYRFIAQ